VMTAFAVSDLFTGRFLLRVGEERSEALLGDHSRMGGTSTAFFRAFQKYVSLKRVFPFYLQL
jgi:hypothetical protein